MKRSVFIRNKIKKTLLSPVFEIGATVKMGGTIGKIVDSGGVGSDSKFWIIDWEDVKCRSIVNEKDLILLEQ